MNKVFFFSQGASGLKGIMHISSNPLARMPVLPRIPPGNLSGLQKVMSTSTFGLFVFLSFTSLPRMPYGH